MGSNSWTNQEVDEWVESIEAEDDEVALERLKPWLLPQTEGFFRAPSGHKLHVRTILPAADPGGKDVRATVLYCHGMNGHVNSRNWAEGFFPRLCAATGFAVLAMDIQGHGYSEGTRAFLEDWEDVFSDWEACTEALLGLKSGEAGREDFSPGVAEEVWQRLRSLPVFVMGTSMGGMVAAHVALRFQRNERLARRCRGAVLYCPALAVDLPPRFVQLLLRSLVVPLAKNQEMPVCVSSSSKVKASWSFDLTDPAQAETAAMEIRDCAHRFPGRALGWHRGMRWALAGAFSKIYSKLEGTLAEVRYPFLVLHDPADKVCGFSGSQRLLDLASSSDKTLQRVDAQGLHALPLVLQEDMVNSAATWMLKRL